MRGKQCQRQPGLTTEMRETWKIYFRTQGKYISTDTKETLDDLGYYADPCCVVEILLKVLNIKKMDQECGSSWRDSSVMTFIIPANVLTPSFCWRNKGETWGEHWRLVIWVDYTNSNRGLALDIISWLLGGPTTAQCPASIPACYAK